MAPVKKPPHNRSKHFLKAWRNFRDISQEEAADRVEVSRGLLSRIENGLVPYNQDILERLAMAYGCEPATLISQDPAAPLRIPIFGLPDEDADKVYEFIRALRVIRDGEGAKPAPNIPKSPRTRRGRVQA